MTTTELIEILRKKEFGGATGRPREVWFCVEDRIISTDGIEVSGGGDGLIAELYLSLPDAEPKKGHWLIDSYGYYPYCSECRTEPSSGHMTDFCPNCGADMRKENES